MALYGSVLRPKKRMADDMAEVRRMGASPAGTAPPPTAMAFGGGAPPSLGNQRPRTPGNVSPPVTGRVGQQITPPGFSGPRQPSPPMNPAPTPRPTTPPPAEAPGTAVTGTAGTTPPPSATADDIDQMIRDLVASQIGAAGKANTAEEEALIRQQMQGELGQSLVDQRARMGRAGFGASGAMGAIEGDVRRAAEMDALDQILGLRRTEDQRSIENAMGAISAENQMRRGAADDALRRMALEALQAEMGLDAPPTTTEDRQREWQQGAIQSGADTNGDGTLSPSEKDAYEASKVAGHQAWSDFNNSGGDRDSLPVLPGPGNGWEVVFPPGTDREGNPKPGQLYNPSTGAIAIYF